MADTTPAHVDRRTVVLMISTLPFGAGAKETQMSQRATIARIWRGRTRREVADLYEQYLRAEGIPPLRTTALGVQLFREDREGESWFTTISYWFEHRGDERLHQ